MNTKPNFKGKCSICGRYLFLVDGRCLNCYQLGKIPRVQDAIISEICNEMMQKRNEIFTHYGRSYNEIVKLHIWLDVLKIPHTFDVMMDGFQICYPNNENRVVSVIEHIGSYGAESDLLEIMGLLTPQESKSNCVLGYLTAGEVFTRIQNHYTETTAERKQRTLGTQRRTRSCLQGERK